MPERDVHHYNNQNNDNMRNEELDLGDNKPREKKEMGLLFKKINNKKQQRDDPTMIENQILSLGMVQSLSK